MKEIEIKEGQIFWCEGKQWRVDCINPTNGNSGCVCLQTNAYVTFGIGEIRELIIKRKENRPCWTLMKERTVQNYLVYQKGSRRMSVSPSCIVIADNHIEIPAQVVYRNGAMEECGQVEKRPNLLIIHNMI